MNKAGLKSIFEGWKPPEGVFLMLVQYWAKGALETRDTWYTDPELHDINVSSFRAAYEAGDNPQLTMIVRVERDGFGEHCILTTHCTDAFLENAPLSGLRQFFHAELSSMVKHAINHRWPPATPLQTSEDVSCHDLRLYS